MPIKDLIARKIYASEYYKSHREDAAINRDNWRKNNPEKQRLSSYKHNLKHRFGISLEEYSQMIINQNGVCKICGRVPQKRNLAVDHNHKTGKLRGLLCMKCNQGIGLLQDNPEILIRAYTYLKETL